MKAIGIKLVDLVEMTAAEAIRKGYRVSNKATTPPDTIGYEVAYADGYKSWCPKDVADKAYFKLNENNDGSIIQKADVDNFIIYDDVAQTLGKKTTLVHAKTISGFEYYETSSCVDEKNYSKELGSKYAKEKVVSKVWDALGFVLQWAKNGIADKE